MVTLTRLCYLQRHKKKTRGRNFHFIIIICSDGSSSISMHACVCVRAWILLFCQEFIFFRNRNNIKWQTLSFSSLLTISLYLPLFPLFCIVRLFGAEYCYNACLFIIVVVETFPNNYSWFCLMQNRIYGNRHLAKVKPSHKVVLMAFWHLLMCDVKYCVDIFSGSFKYEITWWTWKQIQTDNNLNAVEWDRKWVLKLAKLVLHLAENINLKYEKKNMKKPDDQNKF